MIPVELRDLRRGELDAAAAVGARAMHNNPVERAIYGPDQRRRLKGIERGFRGLLCVQSVAPLGAWRAGHLVGIVGAMPPGECRLTPSRLVKAGRYMLGTTPAELARILKLFGEWERHDLPEPHWHISPVAVEPALHGLGVGGQLMQRFCQRMDQAAEVAFLETDKPENISFYERSDFEVVDETIAIGVQTWFMRREPR